MRAEEVRAQAAALLASEPDALVALLRFPTRALFEREAADVAEDARAVSRLAAAVRPPAFDTCVSAGPVCGTFAVRVASPWRPRLLEEVAGCCTLTGLDILDARLLADAGDLALTYVLVRSVARTPVLADTWARLDRLLGRAFADELDLPARLESALPAWMPSGELRLDWDLDDPVCSVLHVVAQDRPGLLYSLSRAVHDAGLIILSARAVVRESMAVDTLRLVGEDGAPIKAPGRLGHLSMHIREALGPS
jgi:UTP:GlnB (protein PII) uridylyltransferase